MFREILYICLPILCLLVCLYCSGVPSAMEFLDMEKFTSILCLFVCLFVLYCSAFLTFILVSLTTTNEGFCKRNEPLYGMEHFPHLHVPSHGEKVWPQETHPGQHTGLAIARPPPYGTLREDPD